MEDNLEHFLSSCSKIDFGSVDLSGREGKFYERFNREIISLCDSLPESIQTDALLFFMKYSDLSIGHKLDFFKNYYVPSWSIIYWLIQSSPNSERLSPQDTKNAMTAHAMAMKLHSLDDHMNDREIPASHLTLLLRSQAWMLMNHAFNELADSVDGAPEIVQGFIDDYYSSIWDPEETESLDSYCDLFRKQMATWLIVPVLLSKRMTADKDFIDAIQIAYGSFGISWRLLDDIMDLKGDMSRGAHSAIYVCLASNKRKLWDRGTGPGKKGKKGLNERVLSHIMDKGLVYRIKGRIIRELESAASTFDKYQMKDLAGEFRSLLKPLKETRDSR